MTGYEELRESAARIDMSRYGKISATGEDRARLMNAMATNDIKSLDPGEGCYTFFLNSQGRILGDAVIFNLGESLLVHTEPDTRLKLQEHLDKYIIADDVTLAGRNRTVGHHRRGRAAKRGENRGDLRHSAKPGFRSRSMGRGLCCQGFGHRRSGLPHLLSGFAAFAPD